MSKRPKPQAPSTPDPQALQPTPGHPTPTTQPPDPLITRHGMFGAPDTPDTSGFGGLVEPIDMPGPSPRPYGEWFDQAIDQLTEHLQDPATAIEKVVVDRGELTVYVPRTSLLDVLKTLRDQPKLRFELSLGVTGVHYPADAGRELHAVYHLVSITHGARSIRLETTAPSEDPHIPSSTAIYPTHDWHEREAYDLFGIVFDGHPALARILLPNDWDGHPGRKDYPLGGVNVQFHGSSVPPADERRRYYP